MYKIFKKILILPTALRYAFLVGKAEDAHCKKNYRKALEYLAKADVIYPLMGTALLERAVLKLRIKSYSESMDDVKDAIKKIKKKNYSETDRDYLIYYACRIGTIAQSAHENIEEELVDQEFRQVTYADVLVSQVSNEVSDYILRNFPLTTRHSVP